MEECWNGLHNKKRCLNKGCNCYCHIQLATPSPKPNGHAHQVTIEEAAVALGQPPTIVVGPRSEQLKEQMFQLGWPRP